VVVSPNRTTEYTLAVEGADSGGEPLTKTAQVVVSAARAVPAPKAGLLFIANAAEIARGGSATLCFDTFGRRATLTPPVQPLGEATRGCFVVAPTESTTYTLAAGPDAKSVTIKVR
ncbi:MAG: hypothetical protein ACRD96_12880, partial [Bryobacteraceae bacterium]